jgi:endonuclease YncB( thermonuclease family)
VFLLIFGLAVSAILRADTLTGRVVGISDGDTLILLDPGNRQVKIRLVEIDAPESGQPYGQRAKEELSALAYGQAVRIEGKGLDKYGRTLGRVFVGTTDVNAAMIERGAAWVYRKYVTDQSLFGLEEAARNAKRGLWSLPVAERLPPWEWRHPTNTPPATAAGNGAACGPKRTCKEMTNCAEARHYLTDCGIRSLDGDHDGTPCNSPCR